MRVELPAGDGAVHPAVVAAAAAASATAVVRVEEGVDGAAPRRAAAALRRHRAVPVVGGDALAAVAARQRRALRHGAIRLEHKGNYYLKTHYYFTTGHKGGKGVKALLLIYVDSLYIIATH